MSRIIDVDDLEAGLQTRIEADLLKKEHAIEQARLDRVLLNAEKLRSRIKIQLDNGSSSSHIRRLQERLEEALQEEERIRERMLKLHENNSRNSPVVGIGHVQTTPSISVVESDKSQPEEEENDKLEVVEDSSDTDEESVVDIDGLTDDYQDAEYKRRIEPHQKGEEITLLSSFKVPRDLYEKMFEYQREGLQWMLKLYAQRAGGILGDEMGLGKTLQVISVVSALERSGFLAFPVLIVCPTTLIRQWINEFHMWSPRLRVVVLHGGLMPGRRIDDRYLQSLIDKQVHVLITSYGHTVQHARSLIDTMRWRAAFLDEGHKIRNPHIALTLLLKKVKTVHRYILSGTPIQNNLQELWSLIDFCFPGKLGTLSVFRDEFAIPIGQGGYVNATSEQVQRAYTSACALRDLIQPLLLRRLKVDVAKQLPPKREQVIFCRLTDYQRALYTSFLDTDDVLMILTGKRNVLYGIDILRKICNHPDLLGEDLEWMANVKRPAGPFKLSCKLEEIVKTLINWQKDKHRCLVFCQTKQMLDLVESVCRVYINDARFLRMDGSTPVNQRAQLINTFNHDQSVFAFFLTTRVGGLGVNLTGADRVLIVDPDWNPSTDQQARERSWRFGQSREVLIYRLIAQGTVEEKILHRQFFKTFLSQRVLKDPKQSRFFKHSDLHDLFTFNDDSSLGSRVGGESPEQGSASMENETDITGDRLIHDIQEISGLRDKIELVKERTVSKKDRARLEQSVADSIATLQVSGLKSRLVVDAYDQSDDSTLSRAVQNIASEADPLIVALAKRLVAFLRPCGRSSEDIFTEFSPGDDYNRARILRLVLKTIADLDKQSHIWTLKADFT